MRTFSASVPPADVAFCDTDDLYLGTQRVAHELVRHYRLPDARMIVSFREMTHAAHVELTAGPEYFIELNDRFRTHRRDIGAALAHEVMHVYLHRLDLSFPGVRDNEILTDTATTYLGAGWLLLDAYREDGASSQKLGYLTPEEFGYVLAKRALLFGEDPSVWFTSAQAYTAYGKGLARARLCLLYRPLRVHPAGERRAAGVVPVSDLPPADRGAGAGAGAGAVRVVPVGAGVRHVSDPRGPSPDGAGTRAVPYARTIPLARAAASQVGNSPTSRSYSSVSESARGSRPAWKKPALSTTRLAGTASSSSLRR